VRNRHARRGCQQQSNNSGCGCATAAVTGACPESFNRTTGVLLAPATESCSFNYTVKPSDLGVTMFFASGMGRCG